MNQLSVYKDNCLIDASYKLNPQAQKLILTCLAKIDSRTDIPNSVTLTASEFSIAMGIERKNAHRELYKAADALFRSSVILRSDDEEIEIHWLQKRVTKLRGEGAVTLMWSDDILKYISQLKTRFTGYKLRNIALLQSTHSIRIYELLMKFKSTGERSIYLEDFKSALGITDRYKEFKVLNRDVLKKSVDELNQRSDLKVKYETIKQGKKVTGLVFSFKKGVK